MERLKNDFKKIDEDKTICWTPVIHRNIRIHNTYKNSYTIITKIIIVVTL